MKTDWREFEVAGVPHKARRLPAMTQMKVIKRLAPTYSHFRDFALAARVDVSPEAVERMSPEELEAAQAAEGNRMAAYRAFAGALRELADEDLEFITRECMSGVERQGEGGAWVKIWNRQANEPMFEDVGLAVIMSIILAVLQIEFAGFFR